MFADIIDVLACYLRLGANNGVTERLARCSLSFRRRGNELRCQSDTEKQQIQQECVLFSAAWCAHPTHMVISTKPSQQKMPEAETLNMYTE